MTEFLAHFYLNTRRGDGKHYKATSSENRRHSLDWYLESPPKILNSRSSKSKDDDFKRSKRIVQLLKAALAELKLERKGSVDHHPISIKFNINISKMTVLISHNCDDSLTSAISVTVLQICDNHCDFNDSKLLFLRVFYFEWYSYHINKLLKYIWYTFFWSPSVITLSVCQ